MQFRYMYSAIYCLLRYMTSRRRRRQQQLLLYDYWDFFETAHRILLSTLVGRRSRHHANTAEALRETSQIMTGSHYGCMQPQCEHSHRIVVECIRSVNPASQTTIYRLHRLPVKHTAMSAN